MALSLAELERIMGVTADHVAERISELTPRETEVANLLADGLQPRQIAKDLGISHKTIDIHRGKVKMKLGAKSTTDMVKCILLKRLVDAANGNGKEARRRASR
jgi:DNA-binding CsgD family transcriptional regulator